MFRVSLISFFAAMMVVAFPDSPLPKTKATQDKHWAFQLPKRVAGKGDGHPVDRSLVERPVESVRRSSREVLLRRVFHVLTGLLPTPEQHEKWMGDQRLDGEWINAVISEALGDAAFGERWARHWLDVARYADTKGAAITENENLPYAYTYRDWVIGALNRDVPFDRFAHLQIAADLMETPKSDLAALGFLNVGRAYQGGFQHLVIADQIDVTTRGFMGLTVACARCHDHKSDPIPTADFYSLHAVFESSVMPKKLPIISQSEDSPGYRKYLEKHEKLARKVHDQVRSIVPEYKVPQDLFNFEIGKANRKFNQKEREKFRRLVGQVKDLEATSPFAPARAMTLVEGIPKEGVIFERGNHHALGAKVPRQFLKIFREEGEVFQNGSGRLDLAHRLTDARNPLTARVWANRVWMHLTGMPLVDSPGDFGVECAKPLQLPLLDHLALYLVENEWSTKKLIRHIMTSETWQRSSLAPEEDMEVDPQNRYLARANRQRKDLEAWRDTALQVSGRLNRKMGGLAVEIDRAPFPPRRTVYGRVRRGYLPSIMRAFDFPGSEEALMRRSQTVTPMQALYLMNSPFLVGEAKALAKKSTSIPALFERVYQRPAREDELKAARAWLSTAEKRRVAGAWDYGYLVDGSLEFQPLPFSGRGLWSGSAQMPDPKLGWLQWSKTGGHPEKDKAIVTSWTAPADLRIRFDGQLYRPSKSGNGIRAKLMRSSGEVFAAWKVGPGSKKGTKYGSIKIKKGERLWCVVESLGDQDSDTFQWNPTFYDDSGELANYTREFSGPGLSPRAQLAQALLLSNEFFYLD